MLVADNSRIVVEHTTCTVTAVLYLSLKALLQNVIVNLIKYQVAMNVVSVQ